MKDIHDCDFPRPERATSHSPTASAASPWGNDNNRRNSALKGQYHIAHGKRSVALGNDNNRRNSALKGQHHIAHGRVQRRHGVMIIIGKFSP